MMKKVNIKTVGIALAAALAVLIFFSRTIYNYNLPVVTAVMPQKGTLSKIEQTSGLVSFAREFDVYTELGGKIEEVLVKEGDVLKAGATLIYMDFGTSPVDIGKELEKSEYDAETKLAESDISEQKTLVDIEKLELNISNTRRKISELKNEDYSVSDYELKQCEADIEKSEESYENTKRLYDAGAVSVSELSASERALESLYEKREHLLEASSEQTADKEENRRNQLTDLEYQLSAYIKDLEARRLDLQNIQSQKDKLNSDLSYKTQELEGSLADYESNRIVRAKRDSVVTAVNVKEGQFIGGNQKLLGLGADGEYVVECRVSIDNNFIAIGDTCRLSNASHSIQGTVSSIKTIENGKIITVSIDGEDVSSGETFDIKFEKTSKTSYTLVPKGAINMDSDGYYLNAVKRRDGIMGKEYYTEKLRVYIGDSDNENVAIAKGVDFPEPVALISDKPFTEGETVKVKNESDFFEN